MATMEQQLKQNAGSVKQVLAAFTAVAAKQPMPEELAHAARVAVKNGYFAWMPRAKRYAFTPEGQNFYRHMKRFMPQVNRALRGA